MKIPKEKFKLTSIILGSSLILFSALSITSTSLVNKSYLSAPQDSSYLVVTNEKSNDSPYISNGSYTRVLASTVDSVKTINC